MGGDYQGAIEAYTELARQPQHALRAGLGAAETKLRLGRYGEALADLEALAATDDAGWHFTLATALRRVGRYSETQEHAREAIRLDPNHAGARLLLAETLEMLGRREPAIEAYRWFEEQLVGGGELPRDPAWITAAAVGLVRYSTLTQRNIADRTRHALNEMLQPAYTRLDRSYWPARIAAAELLRSKYNNDEEDGSIADYTAALRINEKLPEAYVGLGEVLLESWSFEEVEKNAEQALAINPNESTALHLLARKFIRERRYQQAIDTAERALTVNPNDLTAMALRGAGSACRYDEPAAEAMRARAAAINPRCAILHRVLGDALSGIRQYAASEQEYLRAIEYDPTDANARTELGMMYMQWGREDKARDALDAAWTLDPFNKRTKFTLELLDSLQKFARVETPHFIVRYDAEHDPGLGEYVAGYLEEIYTPVTRDYNIELEHKTIIELFPTMRAFGVRITGQPWIHTVGACTGWVIALASPRKAPELTGPYNIARVLKHEFTHTVTLAATQNRIPHWMTEGLSVFQEDTPRSFAWCQLLAEAVRRNSLFTLQSIDWGFMRPKRPTDRQLGYAQSEWMCEYIIERFGYDSIESMLRRYRQGQTQPQVFSEQLGISLDAFDRDFAEWARKQAESWCFDLSPPEDPALLRPLVEAEDAGASAWGRLAKAEFDANEFERAMLAARRALELDEDERKALEVLGHILGESLDEEAGAAERRRYEEKAQPIFERLLRLDPGNWPAAKYLADMALRRKEYDRAVEKLQLLQRLCPLDPASWRGLAGVYLQRGDDDAALPQLLELARIEDGDADIPAQIAAVYKREGKLPDAQYWLRQALFIDPFRADLHQLLGDALMQAGDSAGALREYRMLTRLQPKNVEPFEKAAIAAHKLGDTEQAQALARQAVELSPHSPARSLLP
ncbi:MAG: tetratricopeptide repeat protein [Planctomycetes bacterium]|nr:tetratricopeptide repeat protein [Planctomycetota bacterium]